MKVEMRVLQMLNDERMYEDDVVGRCKSGRWSFVLTTTVAMTSHIEIELQKSLADGLTDLLT